MNGNLYSQSNMSQVDMVLSHLINYGAKCISRLKERKINIYSVFCDTEKRLDSKIKEYVLCKEQPPQVKKMIETVKAHNLRKTA